MPEGDVVWRAARRLHQALAGAALVESDFRVPQLANTDLRGRGGREVVARGKHLLARVEPDLTLHTHLRMDGEWRLYQPTSRWRAPLSDVRVVLGTRNWRAVGCRLPVVELLPTRSEHEAVGHLGPDLLGPDWDEDEAVRRLCQSPERTIADALLDQRNLAGIGNLYKCEVLFLRGISPWRAAGEVADMAALLRLARRMLEANKDRPGQVTTGVGRRGGTTWVYARSGHQCRRCDNAIRRERQAGKQHVEQQQSTFWCPHCQR